MITVFVCFLDIYLYILPVFLDINALLYVSLKLRLNPLILGTYI